MPTKSAFEYLISDRNWYLLESTICFYCVLSSYRVWSTGISIFVGLDHGDNLLLSSFSGALSGFDLIMTELSFHQDAAIEWMCKWWLTPISGTEFHNITQISLEHLCFVVYIINCYESSIEHPSPKASWYCLSEFQQCSWLQKHASNHSVFTMILFMWKVSK